MPLFEKNGVKVLFLHIPKTGGTSIEKALGSQSTMTFYSRIQPTELRVCPQHMVVRDLFMLLGSKGWDHAFSVVRNPYDRIESEYCFRSDIGDNRYGQKIDFSTWVLTSLHKSKRKPWFWDNHFRPQTDFIDSNVTLFRYEDGIETAVREAQAWLGLKQVRSLEIMNASERKRQTWSADALNSFNDFYANDFKELGYRKRNKTLRFFLADRST
ncbi:sulfotransferase family 2 domain-containing protein [Elongatibacter sediminis]|uniref:Sulfotransferase family 2 domain-containing protein n=1 Tax=Elongatibacter sediminis TaxID=3119006 RepID=A0AAW9RAI8_9GAMM